MTVHRGNIQLAVSKPVLYPTIGYMGYLIGKCTESVRESRMAHLIPEIINHQN